MRRTSLVAALSLLALGCSSGGGGGGAFPDGGAGSGGSGGSGATGGAGGGSTNAFVTITGNDQGEAPSSVTINGTDYHGGNGVECLLATISAGSYLSIYAQNGTSGSASHMVLQYWDFDPYQFERDEDFAPPAPKVETFNLSATVVANMQFFSYDAPSDWSQHLAAGPACHTSFTRIDTRVEGTLTCQNLWNDGSGALANVTVQFACDLGDF